MHSREPFKYVMHVLGTGKEIPLNKSNGGKTAKCLPKGLYSNLTLMETMSQHHLVASRVYGLWWIWDYREVAIFYLYQLQIKFTTATVGQRINRSKIILDLFGLDCLHRKYCLLNV